jgi:hypothetical protein
VKGGRSDHSRDFLNSDWQIFSILRAVPARLSLLPRANHTDATHCLYLFLRVRMLAGRALLPCKSVKSQASH